MQEMKTVIAKNKLTPTCFFLLKSISLCASRLAVLKLFLVFICFVLTLRVFSTSLIDCTGEIRVAEESGINAAIKTHIMLNTPPAASTPKFGINTKDK